MSTTANGAMGSLGSSVDTPVAVVSTLNSMGGGGGVEAQLATITRMVEAERQDRSDQMKDLQEYLATNCAQLECQLLATLDDKISESIARHQPTPQEAEQLDAAKIHEALERERAVLAANGELPSQLREGLHMRLTELESDLRTDISREVLDSTTCARSDLIARIDALASDVHRQIATLSDEFAAEVARLGEGLRPSPARTADDAEQHCKGVTAQVVDDLSGSLSTSSHNCAAGPSPATASDAMSQHAGVSNSVHLSREQSLERDRCNSLFGPGVTGVGFQENLQHALQVHVQDSGEVSSGVLATSAGDFREQPLVQHVEHTRDGSVSRLDLQLEESRATAKLDLRVAEGISSEPASTCVETASNMPPSFKALPGRSQSLQRPRVGSACLSKVAMPSDDLDVPSGAAAVPFQWDPVLFSSSVSPARGRIPPLIMPNRGATPGVATPKLQLPVPSMPGGGGVPRGPLSPTGLYKAPATATAAEGFSNLASAPVLPCAQKKEMSRSSRTSPTRAGLGVAQQRVDQVVRLASPLKNVRGWMSPRSSCRGGSSPQAQPPIGQAMQQAANASQPPHRSAQTQAALRQGWSPIVQRQAGPAVIAGPQLSPSSSTQTINPQSTGSQRQQPSASTTAATAVQHPPQPPQPALRGLGSSHPSGSLPPPPSASTPSLTGGAPRRPSKGGNISGPSLAIGGNFVAQRVSLTGLASSPRACIPGR